VTRDCTPQLTNPVKETARSAASSVTAWGTPSPASSDVESSQSPAHLGFEAGDAAVGREATACTASPPKATGTPTSTPPKVAMTLTPPKVTIPAVVTTERYCRPGKHHVLDAGSDWFALGKTIEELATAKGWAGIPRVRATFTGLMDEDIRVQLAARDVLLSL